MLLVCFTSYKKKASTVSFDTERNREERKHIKMKTTQWKKI